MSLEDVFAKLAIQTVSLVGKASVVEKVLFSLAAVEFDRIYNVQAAFGAASSIALASK